MEWIRDMRVKCVEFVLALMGFMDYLKDFTQRHSFLIRDSLTNIYIFLYFYSFI